MKRVFLIILLFCCGCVSSNNAVPNGAYYSEQSGAAMPEWILKPSKNGVIGGVGMCAAHVNGVSGQRELAIKRALEDIASQKGVTVDNILIIKSKSSGDISMPSSEIESYSSHKTNEKVKARIEDTWIHPVSKELYIYMIAD